MNLDPGAFTVEKSTKVAISLPERMLAAIEQERKARGESRSEFFRRAAGRLLNQERESREVERYVRGYRTMPETAGEIEAMHRAGVAVLAEEPW
jgi:metal-responsive CopG/Arc/MetJ family transcriptional regulator